MTDVFGGTPVAPRQRTGGSAGSSTSLMGVLKDKRVLFGVAGAAVIGLVVLLRRGTGSTVNGGGGTTPQTVGTGVMDSSGTDMYNAIQSLGQGWQNDIQQYSTQLDNVQTQLANNTSGLASLTDKLGTTKPPAQTVTTPAPGYGWTKVKTGDSLASIASRAGITVDALKRYNSAAGLNRLTTGELVRVRYAAGTRPGS